MERRAHRQHHAHLPAPLGGERDGALHGRAVAGDDDLERRVHVRDLDHLAACGVGAHLLDRRELDAHDSRHRAGSDRHGFLHELAALAHDADRVREAQRAGDDQRRVLAEAVAGGQRGFETALGAGGRRRHRRGQDCGLCVGR
jgi:hypothetical protein